MWFKRMLIEKESPEQFGYDRIKYNLTESSTSDKSLSDLGIKFSDDLLLCYGDHYGSVGLRELIAKRYGAEKDDVIVTVGACMALFLVYNTLLKPNDHVIVMHSNYPANIEIPRSLGCDVQTYDLKFENQFRMDVDEIVSMLKPETKLVNITYPHNPTGTMTDAASIERLAAACEKNGTYLMVDETYGDLTIGKRLPHASNLTNFGICVESLSKAVGAPGIRTGWVVCKDKQLIDAMIAVKEQVCICGSVIDEECARQILNRNDEIMADIRADIAEKFAILCDVMEHQDVLDWVQPQGGVVCFPRIKPAIEIDTDEFYRVMNEKYGTFVGPGHWFDQDDRYFRVGYAWPTGEQLRKGLEGIISAVKDVRKN